MSTVRVAIAGSSGSIGAQTLDVVRAEGGRYEVVGLGVSSSVETLIAQANEFRPKVVAVADPSRRAEVAA
ncbi:MAG: 1-deoxy-D-xylulose-5-phosphate reductoisomerase, partial [Ilumatobacteraceae bacterium]